MKKDIQFMKFISILQNTKYIDIKIDENGNVNAESTKFNFISVTNNDNKMFLTDLLKKLMKNIILLQKIHLISILKIFLYINKNI